jgi:hypothetical protein
MIRNFSGKVINYDEAKNVLKLNVEKIDPSTELWNYVWELYVRSIEFMQKSKAAAKLFESEIVSLTMNIELVQAPSTPAPRPPQAPAPRPLQSPP